MKKVENRLHVAAMILADELDFDRAAERLHISSLELKERIAQLEDTLSLVLFISDSNLVEMTDRGRRYIEQLRKSQFPLERGEPE